MVDILKEGPTMNIYEEYKKTNTLNLMKYATGMPNLEFKRSQIISDSYTKHESLLVVIKFSNKCNIFPNKVLV